MRRSEAIKITSAVVLASSLGISVAAGASTESGQSKNPAPYQSEMNHYGIFMNSLLRVHLPWEPEKQYAASMAVVTQSDGGKFSILVSPDKIYILGYPQGTRSVAVDPSQSSLNPTTGVVIEKDETVFRSAAFYYFSGVFHSFQVQGNVVQLNETKAEHDISYSAAERDTDMMEAKGLQIANELAHQVNVPDNWPEISFSS